ncbi:MAG: hypothetical protein WCX82_00665 [archaeon]|jgi:hypothetical protein
MFDDDFRKIIIFTCIFGLLGLFIITYFFECAEVIVSDLLSGDIKESVYVVIGQIKSIEVKSNTLFFEFCDSSNCIKAVYFNPSTRIIEKLKTAMRDNLQIKVKARFEKYYGVSEIVIYKIYFEVNNLDYS